ncbi:hypothetical protein BJX70DRAFT_396711 [Aspergillus crustosus]
MPSIENTNILIIGGSSGIGYAVAEQCLSQGATVHIASSTPTRITTATTTLQSQFPSSSITGHVCDLSTPTVETNLDALLKTAAPLDHIVYTAGDKLPLHPLSSITLETIHAAGHIRFFVPLLLGKLLPKYTKPGYKSSYTLTTGAASQKPFPGWSLIGGYITGLHGMTRNLALDLRPLRVNLVSPGAVDTPMWGEGGVPEGLSRGEGTALGKVGTAEEVAEAYVYLMRDSNATGSVVSSNGGSLLM